MHIEMPANARIAVAVSGGADSMALAHMLASRQAGAPLLALSVDHALRPESADEAAQVGAWLAAWPGVTHRILRWDGEKPAARRMESARAARYALMAQACRDADVTHLALAHHRDDQAETFFMRLAAGSGLDGLAAMRAETPYDGLALWRPLLACAGHADLVAYCRAHGVPWLEDPTNANTAYARNRLRALLLAEGLSDKRLDTTIARLARAADALDMLAARLLRDATTRRDDDSWTLDLDALRREPFELSVRVVRAAIDALGACNAYGARLEKIETCTRDLLAARTCTAMTLGGCILRAKPQKSSLVVLRETTHQALKTLPLAANGL